jgi:hypothetical protein
MTANRNPESGRDEAGALLAELMVATTLLLLAVLILGATVSGPIRSIERFARPEERFEGVDGAALAFVTAVRSARPSLQHPAVLIAEPHRLTLASGASVPDTAGQGVGWTFEIDGEHLVHVAAGAVMPDGTDAPRILLHDVDGGSSRFHYLDAHGRELADDGALRMSDLALIRFIALEIVVRDPSGVHPSITTTHRVALRIVGPLP